MKISVIVQRMLNYFIIKKWHVNYTFIVVDFPYLLCFSLLKHVIFRNYWYISINMLYLQYCVIYLVCIKYATE